MSKELDMLAILFRESREILIVCDKFDVHTVPEMLLGKSRHDAVALMKGKTILQESSSVFWQGRNFIFVGKEDAEKFFAEMNRASHREQFLIDNKISYKKGTDGSLNVDMSRLPLELFNEFMRISKKS